MEFRVVALGERGGILPHWGADDGGEAVEKGAEGHAVKKRKKKRSLRGWGDT